LQQQTSGFLRQLRRLKWELPNRLVSTFSSAKSEKEFFIAQLLSSASAMSGFPDKAASSSARIS
jgi:hypothetical protein